MIGETGTKSRRPPTPLYDPTRKVFGLQSGTTHRTTVTAKTEIFDDFNHGLSNWRSVTGQLQNPFGSAIGPSLFWYDAGYHKTQLLTDNQRVRVTIAAPTDGRARIVCCASKNFSTWYGLDIFRSAVFGTTFTLVSGRGLGQWVYRGTVNVPQLLSTQTVELWYDEDEGMLRAYMNGTERIAREVRRNDIRHGPNYRYAGVFMGLDFLLFPGPTFTDFRAWDV